MKTLTTWRAGGTEGGSVIPTYYTLIYQFDTFYYILIYQYIFETYFWSIYSTKSLEYCLELELVLKSQDKPKSKTIALMCEIRTDTKSIRNDVVEKKHRTKTFVWEENTSTRRRCRRIESQSVRCKQLSRMRDNGPRAKVQGRAQRMRAKLFRRALSHVALTKLISNLP